MVGIVRTQQATGSDNVADFNLATTRLYSVLF